MSLTACKVSVWIGGYLVCFYVDFCALYSGVFFFPFGGGLEELDYTFVTDSMKTHTDENSIIL